MMKRKSITKILLFFLIVGFQMPVRAQVDPQINYVISIPKPKTHIYHVKLTIKDYRMDTLILKMPNWTPGYYQIMNYAKSVKNISVKDVNGSSHPFRRVKFNTLRIPVDGDNSLIINYDIATTRQFVANSYVDGKHAYLLPANTFFYIDGFLQQPVRVEIKNNPWNDIVTGLKPVNSSSNKFTARNFNFLYDCPILMGNLEKLPSFKINGIEHRFIGYKLGSFDEKEFMRKLKQVVEAAVAIIGDIPYDRYTFIAIGPGRGGIEHLNNTTISMTDYANKMMSNSTMFFLAHEYFHNYDVKRIRPFELGPFNYDKPDRTNMLWLSEGVDQYYAYLIVRRAGLIDERTLLNKFEEAINTYENNPGRFYQSLVEASYNIWDDGYKVTSDKQGRKDSKSKTISYYIKGSIIGMFLDFAIRHATKNKKSLDDVMQLLYWKYYKKKDRGFTGAEFQQACENIANTSLSDVFEYIYTTKKLNYDKYLGYAGLKLIKLPSTDKNEEQARKFKIVQIKNPTKLQMAILKSWQGQTPF